MTNCYWFDLFIASSDNLTVRGFAWNLPTRSNEVRAGSCCLPKGISHRQCFAMEDKRRFAVPVLEILVQGTWCAPTCVTLWHLSESFRINQYRSASISSNQNQSTTISINQHQWTSISINQSESSRINQFQSELTNINHINQHQKASSSNNQHQSA